jgi:hypothetical protein
MARNYSRLKSEHLMGARLAYDVLCSGGLLLTTTGRLT